jgi:hypothetical protein
VVLAADVRSMFTHIWESSWFAEFTASIRYCASATALTEAACIATMARMPSEKMRIPIRASSRPIPA